MFLLCATCAQPKALRELQELQHDPVMGPAATAAMLQAHEVSKHPDYVTIEALRSQLEVGAACTRVSRRMAAMLAMQLCRMHAGNLTQQACCAVYSRSHTCTYKCTHISTHAQACM